MKKSIMTCALAGLTMAATISLSAESLFALEVNVMPSGVSSPVNIWDSGPYTWPGNTLDVWGNATGTTGTCTYVWNFGDGTPDATGTVTNASNISETHAYGPGSWLSSLTVTCGSESDTDTVSIDVLAQTPVTETNLAIQRGLKYLYLNKTAQTREGQPTYYWHSYGAYTAMAVLAFENHGHLGANDPTMDIFADSVQKGLDHLFSYMYGQAAANTLNTNSDLNNNGRRVYCYQANMYQVGLTTMAIAGSASPTAIVGPAGTAEVEGKTYQEVLEDMVDYLAYAQHDSGSATGGWRYSPNGGSDNSVAQWPALALGEAERAPWGIMAPSWVKTKMTTWLNTSQHSNGGFGYDGTNYVNIAKTGAGIAQMAYAGYTGTGGAKMTNAVNYLNANWSFYGGSWLYQYHWSRHYAHYAVKKGMDFAGLSQVGTHDWQAEYDEWYVDHQNANGSWPNGYWIAHHIDNTAFGLLVMAPLEACLPLANAGFDQEAPENTTVNVDGSASSHTCNEQSLVSYEWDCDYDGFSFSADSTGAQSTCSYAITNGTDTEVFVAALRVTDDQSPAKTAVDTLSVTVTNGNLAPVADPGGPYTAAAGETVALDGSGSTDANACDSSLGAPCMDDSIVSYEWDLDGDGLYGTDDSPADPVGVNATFPASVSNTYPVGLRVTDSFGRTAAQSTNVTTVAISDVQPASYQLISKVYNRRTRMWTVTMKMNMTNLGSGDANNVTAAWTGNTIPAGVVVHDDDVIFTDPDAVIEGNEVQLSDDTFSFSYSRSSSGPNMSVITWDITYTDALGVHHVVRNVLQ